MFCLSGVINVLLFLIARPRLLPFLRPKGLDGQEIQPTPQGTGPASITLYKGPFGSSGFKTGARQNRMVQFRKC